jgi:hypothetical protein
VRFNKRILVLFEFVRNTVLRNVGQHSSDLASHPKRRILQNERALIAPPNLRLTQPATFYQPTNQNLFTYTYYKLPIDVMRATCPAHMIILCFITLTILRINGREINGREINSREINSTDAVELYHIYRRTDSG